MNTNTEKMMREHEDARAQGFDEWMRKEEIKMLISMLPASQNETQQDCLKGILKSAFKTGFDAGYSTSSLSMLKLMMANKREG